MGSVNIQSRQIGVAPYKDVPVVFEKPEQVIKLRFTLLDANEPETNIVHLWELTLDDAR
jgi:hypothetical protein